MKTATRKAPLSRQSKDARPNRVPALMLPLCLAILLAALPAMPRIGANMRLAVSLWGAAASLLALLLPLRGQAARTRRTLRYRFRPLRAHYVQLGVQFCFYAYWGWYWHKVYQFVPLLAAQIVFIYALDMMICWWRRDEWILGFGPLPIVLSANLFLWFKDDWFFLQFLLIATGVLCKEFIKWERDGRRTHIFNPSAIALFVFSLVLIATNSTSITWGREIATTFQRPPNIYVEIFLLGIIVQALFSVTLVTLAAAAVLYGLNLAYTHVTGVYHFVDSNIPAAVFLGLHLLVTDPATSPRKPLAKVVFGGLYGAAVFVLYGALTGLGQPGFYDKLLCVPVLNLMVRALDRWAEVLSERVRIPAWLSPWSPRQRNFAHMGIWTALFAVMWTTGFVGATHPGRDTEFWHKACAGGKPGACKTWAQSLEIDCRGSSADCFSRASEFYRLFNLAEERADRGDSAHAIPLFQQSLALSPDNVRANTHLANALARTSRLDEAVTHYRKALEVNSESVEAHADLGLALFRQGKSGEALVQLDRALAMQPDFAQAHANLAVVLVDQGQLQEAIQHFEAAIQRDPGNSDAQTNLGVTLLRTGKLQEAIPHLKKALATTPDSPEVQANLGGALAQRGQLDEALIHFKRAVELAPDSAAFRANLAAALMELGQSAEAAPQFERALEIEPDSAALHTSYGMALLERGKTHEAIRHFQSALAIDANNAQALDQTAWVMATNPDASVRNGAKAVELAERAVEVSRGQQPRMLATLAASYAEAGRLPQAVETAHQALTLAAEQNQQELAEGLNAMIVRYEAGSPFRDMR